MQVDVRGVVELTPDDPRATVCGHCGRGWGDTKPPRQYRYRGVHTVHTKVWNG